MIGIYLSIALSAFIQGGIALASVYLSAMGYSVHDILLPMSLMGFGGLLGSVLGGTLTDYIQPRILAIILSAFWVLIPMGFYTNSYVLICMNMLLVGLSLASLKIIYLVIITRKFHDNQVEMGLSYRRLILNLGVAAGSALIGYILTYEITGFVVYFFIAGALNLVATIFLPNIRKDHTHKTQDAARNKPCLLAYVLLLLALLLVLLPFSLIANVYSLYLQDQVGISRLTIGKMFALSGVLIACLQVPTTKWLMPIHGKLKSLLGVLLIGVGIGGVQFVHSAWHLYLLTVIWTMGEIIVFVSLLKELLKVTPMAHGKTIASYQVVFSLSDTLAPLLGGAILLVSYSLLWDLTFVMAAASAGILAYLYGSTLGHAGGSQPSAADMGMKVKPAQRKT